MPPTDLSRLRLPAWAIPTDSRARSVAAHRISVPTAWWRREIRGRGLPGEPPDRATLSREEVWRHAGDLHRGDAVFTLLWHALAWGSGSDLRRNPRRLDSVAASPDRARDLLRAAAAHAPTDPARAYTVLRPQRSAIGYLGPSFLTKFLYFAGGGAADHPCLILDRVVATALREWCGWTSLDRRGPWPARTYGRYCGLLGRWADAQGVAADEIERRLFAGPSAEVVGGADQGVEHAEVGHRVAGLRE